MNSSQINNTLTRLRNSIGNDAWEIAVSLFDAAMETYNHDDPRLQAAFDLKERLYESHDKLRLGEVKAEDIAECVLLMSRARDMLRMTEGGAE